MSFRDVAAWVQQSTLMPFSPHLLSLISIFARLPLHSAYPFQFYALATFSQALAVEEIAYLALLQQFCNLVHNDKTMQLRLIGIHALEGAVSSELFHQLELDQQARLVVPLLLFAILDSRADPRNLEEG